MKSFQAKIAEQTLKSLFITEWNSISLDSICKKLKLDKKKVSKHIKSKEQMQMLLVSLQAILMNTINLS